MKHAIDPNKLLTVLCKGECSYRDGRYAFWYETLLRSLDAAGLKVDTSVVYREDWRRNQIAYERHQARKVSRTGYELTVTYEPNSHFTALFSEENCGLDCPAHVRCRQECDGLDHYECHARKDAAETLRYIRRVYPNCTIEFKFPNV